MVSHSDNNKRVSLSSKPHPPLPVGKQDSGDIGDSPNKKMSVGPLADTPGIHADVAVGVKPLVLSSLSNKTRATTVDDAALRHTPAFMGLNAAGSSDHISAVPSHVPADSCVNACHPCKMTEAQITPARKSSLGYGLFAKKETKSPDRTRDARTDQMDERKIPAEQIQTRASKYATEKRSPRAAVEDKLTRRPMLPSDHMGSKSSVPRLTYTDVQATTSTNPTRMSKTSDASYFSDAKDDSLYQSNGESSEKRLSKTASIRKRTSKLFERLSLVGERSQSTPDTRSSTRALTEDALARHTGLPSPPLTNQSLAQELNELAIAHAEGLLDDDEYRVLKQGAFEKTKKQGGMEIPREGGLQSPPPHTGDTDAHSLAVPRETSLRTSRSFTSSRPSLTPFRSMKSRLDARNPFPPRALSGTSAAALGRSSSTCGGPDFEQHCRQVQRARSVRSSGNSVNSNDSSGCPSASLAAKRLAIGRADSMRTSASSGLTISSDNGLLGREYADKSSVEIAAEIHVVEKEKERILGSFKMLQADTLARHNDLDFDKARAILAEVQERSSYNDATVMHGSTDSVARSGKRNRRPSLVARFSEKQASDSAKASGRPAAPRSSTLGALGTPANGDSNTSKGPGQRPIPDTASVTIDSGMSKLAVPTAHKTRRDKPLPPIYPRASGEDGEEHAAARLRYDLEELFRRKSDVATKYQDRLAFLRSAERSAKIRENLH